jgi:hypothetical protein
MEYTDLMKVPERRLTDVRFQQLADMPAAMSWFANIDSAQTATRTRPICGTSCVLPGSTIPGSSGS